MNMMEMIDMDLMLSDENEIWIIYEYSGNYQQILLNIIFQPIFIIDECSDQVLMHFDVPLFVLLHFLLLVAGNLAWHAVFDHLLQIVFVQIKFVDNLLPEEL